MGLLIALGNVSLESLLDEAQALEKKYEWLQAAEIYEKASGLVLNKKDVLKAVNLNERTGFCYYRAAFQVKTNLDFTKRSKLAIEAYKKEIHILEESTQINKQVQINQAKAIIVYIQARIETSPQKKKELLEKWLVLDRQVLEAYEKAGDFHSFCKVCNDRLDNSRFELGWLTREESELKKRSKEEMGLLKKAIQFAEKLDDNNTLARTYINATEMQSWAEWVTESPDEIVQIKQECQQYLKKALELSKKTGDAWLISRAYNSAIGAMLLSDMNPKLAIEYGEKSLKYARISKDILLITGANALTAWALVNSIWNLEDPDKQRENLKKAIEMEKKAIENNAIMNYVVGIGHSINWQNYAYMLLAALESDHKTKQDLLENVVQKAREAMEKLRGYERAAGGYFLSLCNGLSLLAETKSEIEEKRKLLNEALSQNKKYISYLKELVPHQLLSVNVGFNQLALIYEGLAQIATSQPEKVQMLNDAVVALEKSVGVIAEKRKYLKTGYAVGYYFGNRYLNLGEILQKLYFLTKDVKKRDKAIEAYKQAASDYEKAEMPTHVAETYWHTAQLTDELGRYQETAEYYELASEAYKIAAKKIPQLNDFYTEYSLYMQAWKQIEQAKYSHSTEEYDNAKEHSRKSAELHESTEHWSYLAANYLAWANMEEAEGLSRSENTQQAKQIFQEALQQFTLAEESIKQKLGEITASDEKEMIQKLFNTSDLRRKYCQARILLEDAKLLDREGKYLQSSKSYREASQNIERIIEKIESEAERKELELLTVLCQAWEKMALAEEATSSKFYLEAAALFENAKDRCFTRKASLWALGNSNFCKGLAAGIDYQSSLDLQDHARAKRYMKGAATGYLQAGFKHASEYAKATQRLFDAYMYMSRAEEEADPEQTMKYYSMAEKVLQVSAGSFMRAKQPEKTAQVQQMLETVREEKALAVSLNEVLHAPTVTSSTISFTAPSPTNEASVGLERFEHANVQANLVVGLREVRVGESFCLSVEFVNAGREPALLMRVEDFVPPDFIVAKKPEIYRLEETCLNMKGKQIAPLKLVEAKLTLQPSKKGIYPLQPKVHYLDELGQNRVLHLKPIVIRVEKVVLAGRVSTGTEELDSLLLGGLPKEYAVVLTGSPSDERELLIRNFLEAGAAEGGTSFYVATEAGSLEKLLQKPDFYLFLCNPRPKVKVPDLPNVHKLHSKADINNLNIALAQAHRTVQQSLSKRICINIVSDVLANYTVKTTRKWIAELTTDLISKGFTILAIINPLIHTPEELNNLLELFDGEIILTQTEDPLECGKSVVVKKLRNQDYIKNSICLTKQK